MTLLGTPRSDLTAQLRMLGYESIVAAFTLPRVQGDPHPGNIRIMTKNRVGLIDFGIIYLLFFFRKRYNKIYEKYKSDEYLNSKRAKWIGYSVLIISFVSPFITPLIWHNF